jgi:hypothetical protein
MLIEIYRNFCKKGQYLEAQRILTLLRTKKLSCDLSDVDLHVSSCLEDLSLFLLGLDRKVFNSGRIENFTIRP